MRLPFHRPVAITLTAEHLALLEAADKGRLWWEPASETALLDSDSGEPVEVDVTRLREEGLVIHDAVNYLLPRSQWGVVRMRVTVQGRKVL